MGLVLFGIMSVAYPIINLDYTRFTPQGINVLLKDFEQMEKEIVYREKVPSYVYVIAKK